jgi:hypothetical protein
MKMSGEILLVLLLKLWSLFPMMGYSQPDKVGGSKKQHAEMQSLGGLTLKVFTLQGNNFVLK